MLSVSAASARRAVVATASLSARPSSLAAACRPSASGVRALSTTPVCAAQGQTLSLKDLRPNKGSNKERKRKGRGEGSGMGKYATRGMKGTKSRSGGSVSLGFEGGQTPLWRRTPKIGYMYKGNARPLEVLNLVTIQRWVDAGRLPEEVVTGAAPLTLKTLLDYGLLTRITHGVKILGEGAEIFTAKMNFEVTQASASAIAAIEKAGGSVKAVYHSPLALRALLKPFKFDVPIRGPKPTTPKVLAYYTEAGNRGYLSPEVQLAQLKARLAAGVPLPEAAQLMEVYPGGAEEAARAKRMGIHPHTYADLQ